jgi:hypothetical protein
MNHKKASILMISLMILATLGLLSSFGFVIAKKVFEKPSSGEDVYFDEEDYSDYTANPNNNSISFSPIKTVISKIDHDEDEEESQNSSGDVTPPSTVSNLVLTGAGETWLSWAWNNPTNYDFASNIVYIEKTGQSSTRQLIGTTSSAFYTTASLLPNTQYTITINTKDNAGNINTVPVSISGTTTADASLPGAITNLHLTDRKKDSLSWAWTNPATFDFASNVISINGVAIATTSNNMFTANGLRQDTAYTISVQSQDTSGNLGTAVADTQSTCVYVCGIGGKCYTLC